MPSGAWLRPFPAAGNAASARAGPECACGEVVCLLSPRLIPCLLSMHSERVSGGVFVLCCFVCVCVLRFVQAWATLGGRFHHRQFCSKCESTAACAGAALHEDAVVPVEFEDLSQSLLGGGHAFFGPLAWRQRSHVQNRDLWWDKMHTNA